MAEYDKETDSLSPALCVMITAILCALLNKSVGSGSVCLYCCPAEGLSVPKGKVAFGAWGISERGPKRVTTDDSRRGRPEPTTVRCVHVRRLVCPCSPWRLMTHAGR